MMVILDNPLQQNDFSIMLLVEPLIYKGTTVFIVDICSGGDATSSNNSSNFLLDLSKFQGC